MLSGFHILSDIISSELEGRKLSLIEYENLVTHLLQSLWLLKNFMLKKCIHVHRDTLGKKNLSISRGLKGGILPTIDFGLNIGLPFKYYSSDLNNFFTRDDTDRHPYSDQIPLSFICYDHREIAKNQFRSVWIVLRLLIRIRTNRTETIGSDPYK